MIVNRLRDGAFTHARYNMDTKMIEMTVFTGNDAHEGIGRFVQMRPMQAFKLAQTLNRLVDAYNADEDQNVRRILADQ